MRVTKQQLIDAAEVVDAWRIVPRLLTFGFGYLVWHVSIWAMSLPDVTTGQGLVVSTIWGASAVWFGLYTNSGRRWGKSE